MIVQQFYKKMETFSKCDGFNKGKYKWSKKRWSIFSRFLETTNTVTKSADFEITLGNATVCSIVQLDTTDEFNTSITENI